MSTKNKGQQFDTAVIIQADDWKVKVYLGLGGLIALVILGFMYKVEAGIIALVIGFAVAGRIVLVAYHRHQLAGYERRKLEAETAKLEAEAIQARAAAYFVETNSGVFQLAGIVVERFYPAVSASKMFAELPEAPALALPEPARLRRLLDVDFIHLLVVGPSGAGKTTALCHLIDNAPAGSIIYALDPHAQFNEWPTRVGQVIGDGRNYGEIDKALLDLIGLMDRRYKGVEPITQKVLIVADEWLSILDKCPNAELFFTTIGTEARKVNMSLIISSISATVDDLAVSAAIRDNLAQLTLSRTLKERNQGELKWSRKDIELVELPGPYRPAWQRSPLAAPAPPPAEFEPVGWDAGPVAPSPDPVELEVFNLYQAGKSYREISRQIYGNIGGRQVAEIKEILAKWGVSESVSKSESVS